MGINWVLQKNLTKSEILTRIKNIVDTDNESWEEIEVVPFSGELPKLTKKGLVNIPYGSTSLMLNASKDSSYSNGLFYDPSKFKISNYVKAWKKNMLNFDGLLTTFGEIESLDYQMNKNIFIRPNHDGKEFEGRVDSFTNILNWSKKISKLNIVELNQSTEVWISSPKNIEKEWRIFIVDNTIISSCRYMSNGLLDEDSTDSPIEMIKFIEDRINEYKLDDVYVMDIAKSENKYKIIECNCFNGTGFYNHNIEAIVIAINNLVRRKNYVE